MKKALVLPGWMTTLKFYNTDIKGFTVSSGVVSVETRDADVVVGVSIAALSVLKDTELLKGKIILINPPLPKRSLLEWFFRWIKYLFGGLFVERQKFTWNPIRLGIEFVRCAELLSVDFTDTLKTFPKERLVVIRSKQDNFFCDQKALAFLRALNIEVIEVEGGHNWNKYTEEEMNQVILDFARGRVYSNSIIV